MTTTAAVVEGDTEMMCAQMTPIPAEAILEQEVVVALSTMDGTGVWHIQAGLGATGGLGGWGINWGLRGRGHQLLETLYSLAWNL